MSIYISRLTTRHGIDWPPIGDWKRGMGVNRLETFAKNLDISDANQTDLLNSVPTPWARLLLFESALYDQDHPAHAEVVDQWRGLLGTIALSELLRLPLDPPINIDLQDIADTSEIKDAFMVLRPRHIVGDTDEEKDNWHRFHMLSVDNVVIGATSPRTLVFSGISHQCPQSIPFRSAEGRLSDPLRYYERFGDTLFLKLMAQWLDVLIDRVRNDDVLRTMLGTVPVSYGQMMFRLEQLVESLEEWREDFPVETTAETRWPQAESSPFPNPYSILRPIPRLANSAQLDQSDLFLIGRRDVLVCFQRARNSALVNRNGMEIRDGGVRIYDGHWIESSEPLPAPLSFLPPLRVIDDPASFFESSLIQAPLSPETSYPLLLDGAYYLLPYKREILDYFSPEEILRNTSLHRSKANHLTVSLTIPLVHNRAIKVSKDYREDDDVVPTTKASPEALAFWPESICRDAENHQNPSRYFYYKFNQGGTAPSLDFQPLTPVATERESPSRTWLETREPLVGFVGSVEDRKGLLLIKYQPLDSPNRNWKVSIDLGSTHTRAFYLNVERQGDQWLGVDGAAIQPIQITPKVKELTPCLAADLRENFFAAESAARTVAIEEFVSQLVLPQPNNENNAEWLPREGCIYQQSLLDGFPSNAFRHNFKWNSDSSDYALRAFLRCLLVMIQAQALSEGARVVSVSHSYPSVFTPGLVLKHTNEWIGLGTYSGLPIEPPLSEAEAVGRYLQVGEGAAITENTIALDIGGSTTDIAIWASNQLSRQESVKMAAGIAGRYVQTEPGSFRQRLVKILAGEPFKRPVTLDYFKNHDSGYSLMFNAILNSAAASGQLAPLVMSIKSSQEGKLLIAHIMYVFGALLYYVGMLGRKLGMSGTSQFYTYFCGKGGQLLTWIENKERFVEEMFAAGLLGPHPHATVKVRVTVTPSTGPKQEVGRGLLAESALRAARNDEEGGLVNLEPPTVTVGEEGYPGLQWLDELNGTALTALPMEVPEYRNLRELNNFVQAFVSGVSTSEAAKLLGLAAREPPEFRARLKERLFGLARGRVVYDLMHHPDDALLESLFITEVKVLLETVTKNHRLFT